MQRVYVWIIAVGLLVMGVRPAYAGGWAAVTLDGWPSRWVAGERYAIGLTIRQHGVHPVAVEEPVTIEARHLSHGERVVAEAAATDKVGYYRAEVRLPSAGEWQFTITPGWFPPSMVTTQAVEPAPLAELARWWVALPALALALGAAATRRRMGWRGLAAGAGVSAFVALVLWMRGGTAQASDTVRYGAELFAVKGCVSCHRHAGVDAEWSTEIGPALTAYSMDAEWLRQWLANPSALRPDTKMPNLELAPHEIEALIAFLQAD